MAILWFDLIRLRTCRRRRERSESQMSVDIKEPRMINHAGACQRIYYKNEMATLQQLFDSLVLQNRIGYTGSYKITEVVQYRTWPLSILQYRMKTSQECVHVFFLLLLFRVFFKITDHQLQFIILIFLLRRAFTNTSDLIRSWTS